MLTINVICVGKLKEKYLRDAIAEYSKRLSKYCKLNIIELSDEKVPDKINESIEKEIKEKECKKIIAHIPKNSYIMALDLTGNQYTSEEFSEKIENIAMEKSNLTFIIGGTLGMNSELLNMCDSKICFSKMKFPHQLIRVFLLEQIFRGFKILSNETYHR